MAEEKLIEEKFKEKMEEIRKMIEEGKHAHAACSMLALVSSTFGSEEARFKVVGMLRCPTLRKKLEEELEYGK